MFRIEFLGVGNAFTKPLDGNMNNCDWQSNLLVIAEGGKKLMLDCGSYVPLAMMQAGLDEADIDAVYISHVHADHVGGLEWLGFSTYFNPALKQPTLFCDKELAAELWDESLKGGLGSIEGKQVDLTDYFVLHCIVPNGFFVWEGIQFKLVQVIHAMADRVVKHSYGLLISEDGKQGPKVFWTSDTQFCPTQIKAFYQQADLILHDCETSPFPSGVHAHYGDMVTLNPDYKRKMWLYHYHPGAPQKFDVVGDGFLGFALKGDVFTIDATITRESRE